jgi:quinol monooxygenase YgiN
MSIHLIVTFIAKTERRSAFVEMLKEVRTDLMQAPGCEAAKVFCNTTDPNVFTLMEMWESEARHRAHLDSIISSGAWDAMSNHLASAPSSGYYREL